MIGELYSYCSITINSYMVAVKTVAEMAENQDLGTGPPNITSSGSSEMVGLSTLILESLQLTLVYTHGQLCRT